MIAALAAGRRNKKTSRDSIDPHSTRARCPVDNATGSSTRARRRRSRSREDAVSVADGNRTERRRRLLSRGRSEGATRFFGGTIESAAERFYNGKPIMWVVLGLAGIFAVILVLGFVH